MGRGRSVITEPNEGSEQSPLSRFSCLLHRVLAPVALGLVPRPGLQWSFHRLAGCRPWSKPMRFFTTEGPVRSEDNYCLPPLQRWDLEEVLGLIEQKKYFLLHAPRQTGKTTCLLALTEYLNREGRYRALYANIEVAQSLSRTGRHGMAHRGGADSSGARDSVWAIGSSRTGAAGYSRLSGGDGRWRVS